MDSNSTGSSDTFVCSLEVLPPVRLDLKHNIYGASYSDCNRVHVMFVKMAVMVHGLAEWVTDYLIASLHD